MDGLWILTLILGVPVGVFATVVYDSILRLIRNARHGRVDINGTWIEWVPNCYGRQFSIGKIRYDVFRRQYVFDGTNYRNDGSPFCHWRTVSSYLDLNAYEYHYVFATKDVMSMQTTSFGYGVMSLVANGKRLIPAGGSYMYATGKDTAMQMSHSMKKIDPKLFPEVGQSSAQLLELVLPLEWSCRSESPTLPPSSS